MPDNAALDSAKAMFRNMVPEREPTLSDRRRGYERLMASFPVPREAMIEAEDVGGVPCEWVYAPEANPRRVLLLMHGGGYVMGSAAGYREFAYALSLHTGARVLVIDYRLAPEYPYPAAVEDVLDVYRAVREAVADAEVFLIGDSAGGGLALGSTIAIRDRGMRPPLATIAISPVTDATASAPSLDDNGPHDPAVSREGILRHVAGFYLTGRPAEENTYASPLHADLSSLPPLLLMVGSSEALLDDSRRFFEAAVAAGTDVELIIAPDMIHVWPLFSSILPEGMAAIESVGRFVNDHAIGQTA